MFKKDHRQMQQVVLGVWILGPSVYFILEWGVYQGPFAGDKFEMFKVGQDLAAKLWAGILGVHG
jgi:hypothetical protein